MINKKRKIFLSVFFFLLLIFSGIGYYTYLVLNSGFNIDSTVYIKIDDKKDYNELLSQIQDSAKAEDITTFKRIASILNYPDQIKSGRYAISPDMSILQAIRMLRSGQQAPVKFTFNNIRTKNDFARRIAMQLMVSEAEIIKALNDNNFCNNYGFSEENILCMFIPDTYEIYWNISLISFFDRMHYEYKKFWTEEKIKEAKETGLNPIEVSILASIVEEECYFTDEYPVVAGLYLNRLNKNMLLQADPTVKYALNDFTIRRVLNKHLVIDSPYNTYKNTGLPPGPIRIPSIAAINGVLHYRNHNYIYMCAKEDFSGRHNFSVTHAEHERNRSRYQKALNRRGIYN